jgi:transposase
MINFLLMRKSKIHSKQSNTQYNHLPLRVSEKSFNKYFQPFLSRPQRSRKFKIPLWKVFNYILYQLHTGCQWSELPIATDTSTGNPEISYVAIWNWFNRWSNDRSFEIAFVNSVKELRDKKKLRLRQLHGDGSNVVAKKGANLSVIPATSTRKAARS